MLKIDGFFSRKNYIFWLSSAITGFFIAHLLSAHIYAWANKSLDVNLFVQTNLVLTELLPFAIIALYSDKKTLISGSKVGFLATLCTEIISRPVQILANLEAGNAFFVTSMFSLLALGIIIRVLAKLAEIHYPNLWVFTALVLFVARVFWHINGGSVFVESIGHHVNILVFVALVILGSFTEYREEKEDSKSHNVIIFS